VTHIATPDLVASFDQYDAELGFLIGQTVTHEGPVARFEDSKGKHPSG